MLSHLDPNFEYFNQFLSQHSYSKLIILCDNHTHDYCVPSFLGQLETTLPFEILEIEAGEEMKTLETAAQLWQILLEYECDRKTLMINLGGGVIGDMGGFVASTYKRGIDFVNIPTTLLAMCDASIGGKTGIDFAGFKNCIGSFTQPECILLYPDFLDTLDYRELRSGFAEMLKHGLITDFNHWNELTNLSELNAENVKPHIQKSVEIKSEVVQKDFKEQNIRKTLNFGHTVGHAIESYFLNANQPIPHGEGVAAGMIMEGYISWQSGLLSEVQFRELESKISKFFPYLDIRSFNTDILLQIMKNDKKNKDGKLLFVGLKNLGEAIFDIEIDENLVLKSLNYYKSQVNS